MATYQIVLAQKRYLHALAAIEAEAALLFPEHLLPDTLRHAVIPLSTHEQAFEEGRLWVALGPDEQPVGFALVEPWGEAVFLVEIDVSPTHQQQGLGTKLIDAVKGWSKGRGFSRLWLTTFASPPWNAPFYEKIGFRRLREAEMPTLLRQQLQEERDCGLCERVAMECLLTS